MAMNPLRKTVRAITTPEQRKQIVATLKKIGVLKEPASAEQLWDRIVMYREVSRLLHSIQPERLNTLEISGKYWGSRVPFKSYTSAYYPEFDICKDVLPDKVDLIIAEQVFEHLAYPYRAAKNVYEMLNPGGWFLISTPFLLKVHNYPIDCSRWTETGMQYFLEEAGFSLQNIQTGSWGNRACVKADFERWQEYRAWRHSLKNEPEFPIVVWALARK